MTREPYKTYSREFKIEAVRLAEESDRPVTQIARELGVRQNQIYKWKKLLETHSSIAFPGRAV
jgi:transposase